MRGVYTKNDPNTALLVLDDDASHLYSPKLGSRTPQYQPPILKEPPQKKQLAMDFHYMPPADFT